MKIQFKYTPSSEPILVNIVPGMVLGAVLDEEGKVNKEAGYTVPYLHFAYVVSEIRPDGIYTRDTGHNNLWFIKKDELQFYELVNEYHPHNEIDASFVNDQLRKS